MYSFLHVQQQGRVHIKEVEEGVLNHPMVQNFWEEHRGWEQEIMMRVLGKHIKALERQVQEIVLI